MDNTTEPRERQLATIREIAELQPIEGADRIEHARVDGWWCIVKKGEFKVGDPCVYFEIDSVLPAAPWSAFMERSKYRVKTMKMRGVLSQGLALPVDAFQDEWSFEWKTGPRGLRLGGNEGQDLTEILGVKKYDPDAHKAMKSNRFPIKMEEVEGQDYMGSVGLVFKATTPAFRQLGGVGYTKESAIEALRKEVAEFRGVEPEAITLYEHVRDPNLGDWPEELTKTDEPRIQNSAGLLREFSGKTVRATVKLDGMSATYWKDKGRVRVFSRNFEILEDDGGPYWEIAKRFQGMLGVRDGAVVQGEICGPGVQGNKLELPRLQFFVFNAFTFEGGTLEPCDSQRVIDFLGCSHVPTEFEGVIPDEELTIDHLLAKAEGKYEGTNNEREGLVLRVVPMEYHRGQRLSLKVISNKFLLKGGD